MHVAHLQDGLNLKLHNTEEDANNLLSVDSHQNRNRPMCTLYFYEQIISLKESAEIDPFHNVLADTFRKRKRIPFIES